MMVGKAKRDIKKDELISMDDIEIEYPENNETIKINNRIEYIIWAKDDKGFYITPLIGFTWGDAYGRSFWVGWLKWLLKINIK